MSKPNILFVFSDQQRWDTCGCYNENLKITPNIDKMAEEGVKFENAFTCQPVCGPVRSTLQTGKYPAEMVTHLNHEMLPLDEKHLADYMNQAGYQTGYVGKWHLASCGELEGPNDFTRSAIPEERRGGYKDFWLAADTLEFTSHSYDGHMFDINNNKREFPKGKYRADVTTDWAIEAIEKMNKKEAPFFLFVSFLEPHHQNDHDHYEGPHGSKKKYGNVDPPKDLINLKGDWEDEYPDYLGCVEALDNNLGRLNEKLKQLGIDDNTVVFYTSDHGSHFRTRNSEYKRSCHDGCIRIPMVAKGPGFNPQKDITELVNLIDIAPTILRVAGIDTPKQMHGRPLQDLTVKRSIDWRKETYIQISESQCGRAIRTHKWKYSVRAPKEAESDFKNVEKFGGKIVKQLELHPFPDILIPYNDVYVEDFLYDLENDPHEQNNLVKSPEYKEVRKELSKILIERIIESGDPRPRIVE